VNAAVGDISGKSGIQAFVKAKKALGLCDLNEGICDTFVIICLGFVACLDKTKWKCCHVGDDLGKAANYKRVQDLVVAGVF